MRDELVGEPRPLRRIAHASRRRRGLWLVIGAVVVAHGAVVIALTRARAAPPAVLHVAAPTLAAAPAPATQFVPLPQPMVTVVVAPTPAVSTWSGDLGPCPAEVTAAPRRALAQPDAPVDDVAVSPRDARSVVAWNRREVFLSGDGGGAWASVLAGPGAVLDAGFDCHGRLMVYRTGGGFGLRAGTQERWTSLEGFDEPDLARTEAEEPRPVQVRVVGGGPYAAVVGSASDEDGIRLALSVDGGATWRYSDLGYAEHDGVDAVMTAGGTVRLALPWVDCMSEGMRVATIHAERGLVTDDDTDYVGQGAHPVIGGAVYGFSWGSEPTGLRVYRDGRWRPVAWAAPATEPDDGDVEPVLIGGARAAIRAGDRLWLLSGTRTRQLEARWDLGDVAPRQVDAAGRVWGVDARGELVRRP